ncbi:DUF2938 domain-containing protein [Tropicibacter naphthalenivorans]|uniref:DUF2938 domain-containing protein n=1 Tax=Tropicibacter naphthalenivorans TaxID=441103 RepID=A0A0P1G1E3_9RHOB|nr:DUF2938 domain-containing protein [Tropicibacter naphthalenivorans]CUH75350.1 hypothetical protein TRN7648_00395 [Tropicibacter naphthalenivorans]SMC44934.1 Protein of unknown function [Tropicibacter naphthalenivorans]
MGLIWAGVLIGIGGTVAMDIWALLLHRLAGQGMPNWGNVGRWVGWLPRGRVFHDDIGLAAPVRGEVALGWAFHYFVGVVYGAVFALLVGPGWFDTPTFWQAWLWGIVTISGGWFLLHPGMGLGWALSGVERPWKARMMGLVAHTVFGLGIWGMALGL